MTVPGSPAIARGQRAVPPYRASYLHLSPAPDTPDPSNVESVRQWVSRQKGPTMVDVFCGSGGLSLGLKNAGFTPLVGVDHDPIAIETYAANIGGLAVTEDLENPERFMSRLDEWGISGVDLVVSGVPCQPFSLAGRSKRESLVRAGKWERADHGTQLWKSFVAVVRALHPPLVVVENVPDLAIWSSGAVLAGLTSALSEAGYRTEIRILRAYYFGVPQPRARLLLVGSRNGRRFVWPQPSELKNTLWHAIGDLPEVPPAQREEAIPYHGPRTEFQRLMRKGVTDCDKRLIYDHITRDVRPDDAIAFSLLKQGDNYSDLPQNLQRYRSDVFSDKYKRLSWDGFSRSITAHLAKDGYWYIHPNQDRMLSVREAARIQTFPDWFRFAGFPTNRLRQIGNAVPPMLAEAVGRQLMDALRQPRYEPVGKTLDGLRDALIRWSDQNPLDIPWRAEPDPWKVLVGEMLAHTTRSPKASAVYDALLQVASSPDQAVKSPQACAEALLPLSRQFNPQSFINIARLVVERFGGHVPGDLAGLLSLPGVTRYTADAVLCHAFGKHAIPVNSGVTRVVRRLWGLEKRPGVWECRSAIIDLAGSGGPSSKLNRALHNLAERVCRVEEPYCPGCPLQGACSYSAGASAQF